MNGLFRMLMLALVIIGVSLQASAKKDKMKYENCRWLQAVTTETCEGREYARALVKCVGNPYATTAYCNNEKAGDANECLDDDSGKTKSCFKKTLAFSEQLKKSAKKNKANARIACSWPQDMVLPANDIYVADLSSQLGPEIPDDCRTADFVYRKASCVADGKSLSPMLFCRIEGASNDPHSCMEDEANRLVRDCRTVLEPILGRERYNRTQSSGAVR